MTKEIAELNRTIENFKSKISFLDLEIQEKDTRIEDLEVENEKLEEKLRVREMTRINRWVQTGRALEPKETAC